MTTNKLSPFAKWRDSRGGGDGLPAALTASGLAPSHLFSPAHITPLLEILFSPSYYL